MYFFLNTSLKTRNKISQMLHFDAVRALNLHLNVSVNSAHSPLKLFCEGWGEHPDSVGARHSQTPPK